VQGQLDRLAPIPRLGDHDDAGALEHVLDDASGEWVVIGDDGARVFLFRVPH